MYMCLTTKCACITTQLVNYWISVTIRRNSSLVVSVVGINSRCLGSIYKSIYNPRFDSVLIGKIPGIFPWGCVGGGGKDGRCVGLTTLPLSCSDCLQIWMPPFPGTLKASPYLYRNWFTFLCFSKLNCYELRNFSLLKHVTNYIISHVLSCLDTSSFVHIFVLANINLKRGSIP
jgi:hypothetical protein